MTGRTTVGKRQLRALLLEARDLLDHNAAGPGSHTKKPDGSWPPCAACALEARIDEAVSGG